MSDPSRPAPASQPPAHPPRTRRRRLARRALQGGVALAALLLALVALDRLFPPPLERLDRPAAVLVLDRAGQPLRAFLPADERWRFPTPLSELPPELIAAVVTLEDSRYRYHPGVDPLAVLRAAWSNFQAGEVVSGASTIPMQLARMMEPDERTWGAKLREAWRALQLSARFSKDELLNRYLDLAPYGGNLEGVGAASYFYFGKPPAGLSLGEIALLAALPRCPTACDPVRQPAAARAAREEVLDRLAASGRFAGDEIAAARRQPLPARRRQVPFAAPHFARWAAARAPGRLRVATTLDRATQQAAERILAARRPELAARGIANAAAVVIEIDDRRMRAMVGSLDFFDRAAEGQVNGAEARRSPGSTLKPFLFALAYDRGTIVPDSFLLDVPTDFAGYVAENYDGRYRGRVTARHALIDSLNAPSVRLLSDLGLPGFVDLLRRGGVTTLDRPPERYGLPLILGAGEVTLVELTNLYATLADGGVYRPLRFLVEGEAGEGEPAGVGEGVEGVEIGDRIVSERSARLVTETLTYLSRPDLPEGWRLTRDVPRVAWKTGTSYGHRDAWAVGFAGRYAIGVWVGNFDGTPVTGISGSDDAAPLLFDLFRALSDSAGPRLLTRAEPLPDRLAVCDHSRLLPGPYCPRTIEVPVVAGSTRLAPCDLHRRIFVDATSGERLTAGCLGRRPFEPRVLTLDPPELVAWWRAQEREPGRLRTVPAVSPGCPGAGGGEPPRIVSPDAATPYRLRSGAPAAFQRIPLTARAGSHARRLYWYQDGILVGSGEPGRRLFVDPEPGEHRLVVVDDAGGSDAVTYTIEGVAAAGTGASAGGSR